MISRLILLDLVRRPGSLAVLVAIVVVASGSAAFSASVGQGFDRALAVGIGRAGADIAIVPQGSADALRRILVTGRPEPMSFPDPTRKVRAIPGAESASAQVFVASAQADCCTAGDVLIVAFDPATDFVVGPWIRRGTLVDDASSAVVGSNLKQPLGLPIEFYGTRLVVKGALAPTGWGYFDNAAFVTSDAVLHMADASRASAKVARLDPKPGAVSVVWVRAQGEPSELAGRLRAALPGVDVVELGAFLPQVRESASVLGRGLKVISAILVVGALLTIAGVFALAVDRRRRDLAVIRSCGGSRRGLMLVVMAQAGAIGALGGLLGGTAGSLAASLFALWMTISSGVPVLAPTLEQTAVVAVVTALVAALAAAASDAGPALAGAMRGVADVQR